MIVRLQNPAKANSSVARAKQYHFDADGYTTCGHLDDLRMLIEQQNCEPVEVMEDDSGMNGTQFYLIDFKSIVSSGEADTRLEQELNKIISEYWKVLLSKNSKVVFYK